MTQNRTENKKTPLNLDRSRPKSDLELSGEVCFVSSIITSSPFAICDLRLAGAMYLFSLVYLCIQNCNPPNKEFYLNSTVRAAIFWNLSFGNKFLGFLSHPLQLFSRLKRW
jgi:hypothetical protein